MLVFCVEVPVGYLDILIESPKETDLNKME